MEMEPGKLFIGGISWDTNEERLREYFHIFGEVIEAVIMKDRNTGRARGFGFVVFADPAVAERVVRVKHVIDGRTVEAKKAVPRDDQNAPNKNNGSLQGSPSPGPTRTKKIFVGGLASTVTESDFQTYFDQFGTITDVVVMYDHNTQRPRGFGFITYESEDSVDKVLLKTFHDLNGKMVEVKRAVPKELSPGPSRNQLGGYSNGLSRVSSFLNAYTQGYSPNSVGRYGVRVDGRFNSVTVGRSAYSPFSPSGYGMESNFEPGLSPRYGGNGNFSPHIGYDRGWSPFYNSSSNRYDSPVGFAGGTSVTGPSLSSTSRNIWETGNLDYPPNASKHDSMGYGSGSNGLVGAFGSIGTIRGSSNISVQGGGTDSMYGGGNISYSNMDNSFGLGVGGYRRNNWNSAGPTLWNAASSDILEEPFENLYGGGSFYGDPAWRSSSPEFEGSGAFGYELGKVASDVTARNSAGYVGGYTVANRANGEFNPC